MIETATVLMKISLVVFMAGNLLDMGLRLNPANAVRGLRDVRFVLHTLFWGFVVGPAVALLITRVIPLESPYAMGLILLGMAPCAPFVPVFVDRARGDLGYTGAFMLLVSLGTIVFMPLAVPFLVQGLSVSAWAIAKPLLIMVLIPLAIGMAIRHYSSAIAAKIQPVVKKITGLFTIATFVLIAIVYGQGILSVAGSLAVASQVILFFVLMAFPYWFGFGMRHAQKIVLSIGLSTRNLGAAIAPLFSVAGIDQRAFVMVVLALPVMVVFALLSVKLFGSRDAASPAVPAGAGRNPS
jgi:BASS family bile acid:Na+ symporter